MSKIWKWHVNVDNENLNYFRYGETDLHIAKECLYRYGISFTLPKDSIFTNKFGEVT